MEELRLWQGADGVVSLAPLKKPSLHDVGSKVAQQLGVSEAKGRRIAKAFDDTFARPFAAKLQSVTLKDILKKKNPYLYRASGVKSCRDLVNRAYADYSSASVEGFFGQFLEAVARIVSGGIKPAGAGEIDLDKRREDRAYLYAIKSGPSAFNSSSLKKAQEQLLTAESKLSQDDVVAIKTIACAYGRKRTTHRGGIRYMASKDFWGEVSGDPDFYSKLLEACDELRSLYAADVEEPRKRLLEEARDAFCSGSDIDWSSVLKQASG